ncbi:hypothetical protein E3N88_19263 [Mikania micrantha]|uniref:Uncharacterized protein n=1 Tax=Mikania micrantha TaxID=192012 RepID=A0A5N6NQQ0_9ASTR|nr:hypothetical protein E3N88_19263 [Mikania micrantha]
MVRSRCIEDHRRCLPLPSPEGVGCRAVTARRRRAVAAPCVSNAPETTTSVCYGLPAGAKWFPGGAQVLRRWCAGGAPVVRRWAAGGAQVGRRWCAGGAPVVRRWGGGGGLIFGRRWQMDCGRRWGRREEIKGRATGIKRGGLILT